MFSKEFIFGEIDKIIQGTPVPHHGYFAGWVDSLKALRTKLAVAHEIAQGQEKKTCTKCWRERSIFGFSLVNRKESLIKRKTTCKECARKASKESYLRRKKTTLL